MDTPTDIRPSSIAGQWYPADHRRLSASVDEYIQSAVLPEIPGEVVAIIVPHAGHRYSGPVAGYGFAALSGLTPDLVAVVSPMHYPVSAPLITTAHAAYGTPLGVVPVDRAAVADLDSLLRERLDFGITAVRNDPEHSLEIELPFLQRVLKEPFQLLPIMLREQTAEVARSLGEALAHVLRNRRGLLVASSDLSHFYTAAEAKPLDETLLRQVENYDPQGVLDVETEGRGFACGKGAVAAVLWAAQALGADQTKVLRYATSGDITGDFSQVVGYGAAVIYKSCRGVAENPIQPARKVKLLRPPRKTTNHQISRK